ncbi:hypothetical protein ABZ570_25005 [Micromonospora sp. NPDC007271]|uniref:hypothetical protein n=1 Tax=Micromonospora sp. NPDC007271 TaxID=3154587 RepID=UPI003407AEFE
MVMQRSDLLNEAECKLWDAFPRGTVVDLGDGDPTAENFDPDTWLEDRQVRGEVIARLLLGVQDREAGYVARVALTGARVIGELNIGGGEAGYELLLDRCWVDAPPDFTGASTGPTTFHRTRLPGLTGRDWQARGSVSFDQSTCCGETRLIGAHIGGRLSFNGATLTNPNGVALYADRLTVDQSVLCSAGFTATGETRLPGAHIGSQLAFIDAALTNPNGYALNADWLTVDQGMFCSDGFTATGEVNLLGAHIGSQLDFSGATLTNSDGYALNADRLTVDQDMFCSDGFTATGETRLPGAHIGSQLDLSGATLTNPNGDALNADRLTVDQDMFCSDGFNATGQVRLLGARIAGQLAFIDATLANPGGVALDLEGVECPHVRLPSQVNGRADLANAHLGVLDVPAALNQPPMRLTGLTYTDLDPDPDPPARHRITWLRRDPAGFHPQPYEQLAAYYRSIGHDRDARRVMLAKQRTRRRNTPGTWRTPRHLRPLLAAAWRIPGWLVDALSGYGYVPWRAFCWLIAAVITGTALLHDVAPKAPTSNTNINALLLALDATVPTAPFGIRENVTLTGTNYAIALGLQILGYALVLAVVPAISRTLSRVDR